MTLITHTKKELHCNNTGRTTKNTIRMSPFISIYKYAREKLSKNGTEDFFMNDQ